MTRSPITLASDGHHFFAAVFPPPHGGKGPCTSTTTTALRCHEWSEEACCDLFESAVIEALTRLAPCATQARWESSVWTCTEHAATLGAWARRRTVRGGKQMLSALGSMHHPHNEDCPDHTPPNPLSRYTRYDLDDLRKKGGPATEILCRECASNTFLLIAEDASAGNHISPPTAPSLHTFESWDPDLELSCSSCGTPDVRLA